MTVSENADEPPPATRREVTEIHEFLGLCELAAVRFLEVSAKRLAEDRDLEADTTFEMQIQHRVSDTHFEPRFKMVVEAPQANYVIDVNLAFILREPVEPAPPLIVEFVERVAVMAAYPFLREALHTAATRLGVEVPVLGLLRAGQFKLERPEEDGDPVSPSQS